jgi:hypothetical protein
MKHVAAASAKCLNATHRQVDKQSEFFVNGSSRGGGTPCLGDIFDPSTMNYFQTYRPESTYGKTITRSRPALGYKGIFAS